MRGGGIFRTNLEKYVRAKASPEKFLELTAKLSVEFDIDKDLCLKYPASAAELLQLLTKEGIAFPELDNIDKNVDALMG